MHLFVNWHDSLNLFSVYYSGSHRTSFSAFSLFSYKSLLSSLTGPYICDGHFCLCACTCPSNSPPHPGFIAPIHEDAPCSSLSWEVFPDQCSYSFLASSWLFKHLLSMPVIWKSIYWIVVFGLSKYILCFLSDWKCFGRKTASFYIYDTAFYIW